MRFLKKAICFAQLLLSAHFAVGQKVVLFDGSNPILEFSDHLYLMDDSTGEMPVEKVLAGNWTENTQKVPNLGVSKDYHWARFTVRNESTSDKLQLTVASPILDEVCFFQPLDNGKFEMVHVGEKFPYEQRTHPHQYFIFDLNLAPGLEKTYLLRVQSMEQVQLPVYIASANATNEWLLKKDVFSGIFFGILLVMLLYNLFIFIAVRDRSYFFYVLYILTLLGTQSSFMGYSYRIVWPESPWLAANAVFIFSALVTITGMLFMRQFLELKTMAPRLNKVIVAFIVISCLIIPIGLIVPEAQLLAQMNGMVTALITLYTAIAITRKGSRAGKFYLIAWTVFLIGVFIFVMKDLGILPYNAITVNMMPIGSAIEVILLSFALADRINTLKSEKQASQAEALQALRENQRIIREQNVILEQKVTERTVELQESNEELNVTLENLKSTQSQLVESEKMASLGQLTAGIAHEINNPINFVTANIKPLRRDFEDIMSVFAKYDVLDKDNITPEAIAEINALKAELDTDYLKDEIGQLLDGIDEGAARTAEIVKGLRIFSRLDETALKAADINEGIEATLSLLRNQIDHESNTTIETDFGDIPVIQCYPGKLNQLFMNILNNGLQAIKASTSRTEPGLLKITTSANETHVKIEIGDNGVGMSPEIKARVFEPFFTTKEVGQGTGLGLSIAYKIVEIHHGHIEIETTPGKGSHFEILIPKNLAEIEGANAQ